MSASKVVDLRKLLAARFPHPSPSPTTVLSTGVEVLDRIAGHGLPKSAITELITPHISAGSASLIHALLRSAKRNQHFSFFARTFSFLDRLYHYPEAVSFSRRNIFAQCSVTERERLGKRCVPSDFTPKARKPRSVITLT